MTAQEAFRTGFGVLRRHPWLAFFPLLWEVALLGLYYLGVPSRSIWAFAFPYGPKVPQAAAAAQAGSGMTIAVRGLLPSPLPSVENLQISLAPAYQPMPDTVPLAVALVAVLLVPLAEALVTGAYLGLIGEVLEGRRPSFGAAVQRAWQTLPAFFALSLLGWLATMFLPAEASVVVMVGGWLLFALLPYALAVLRLPLVEAVMRAPGLLWGRFGDWFGLGWRTFLVTALFTLLWSLAQRSLAFALLFYPLLATALVAAAAALVLRPEPIPDEPMKPAQSFLPLAGILLWVGAVWFGQNWAEEWQHWQPTREATFASMWGQVTILYVEPFPEGGGEVVIFRDQRERTGVANIRRGRFGWRTMDASSMWSRYPEGAPVAYGLGRSPTSGGRAYESEMTITGEIYDPRVAYLQVRKQRYPIGQDGPYFIIRLGERGISLNPQVDIVALDAQGNPVPPVEVRRP